MTSPLTPPKAAARPQSTQLHGVERTDEFGWLRDRDNPEVIVHLEAENAYTAATLASTEALQETLFQEIKNRIQETDLSLPTRKGPWSYLTRTIEGVQYPIHLRRPRDQESDEATDQLLLDENALAEGHDFFSLGTFEPSHDHHLLAWATGPTRCWTTCSPAPRQVLCGRQTTPLCSISLLMI
jgi:oligopeptidase B